MSFIIERGIEFRGELSALLTDFSFNEASQGFSPSARGVMSGFFDGEKVAVKPFIDREGAAYEALMQQVFEAAGITTCKPVSIIMGEEANYLITRMRGDIKPLDQLDLRSMEDDELRGLCGQIGVLGAKMHGSGLIHGDFQPKNLFQDGDRELGVLDLDMAELHTDQASPEFAEGALEDIELISAELQRHIDIPRREDAVQAVINTYTAALE